MTILAILIVKHNKETGQSLNMNQKNGGIAKNKLPVRRKIYLFIGQSTSLHTCTCTHMAHTNRYIYTYLLTFINTSIHIVLLKVSTWFLRVLSSHLSNYLCLNSVFQGNKCENAEQINRSDWRIHFLLLEFRFIE